RLDRLTLPTRRSSELFATDNYAFQAFDDGGAVVGIGWLANWADASPEIDFPTAMTLPRNLVLSEGALLTPPVDGVETLRSHLLRSEEHTSELQSRENL